MKDNILGLKYNEVKIVPYISEWKKIYEKEEQLLSSVLGDYNIDLRHIGSTSIPGLAAKPIIDIMLAINQSEKVIEVISKIVDMGYYYFGECGRPGRKFFVKEHSGLTTHHLHLVKKESKYWRTNLFFKNILTKNDDIKREYEKVKRDLAQKFENDRDAYREGKSNFISKVVSNS